MEAFLHHTYQPVWGLYKCQTFKVAHRKAAARTTRIEIRVVTRIVSVRALSPVRRISQVRRAAQGSNSTVGPATLPTIRSASKRPVNQAASIHRTTTEFRATSALGLSLHRAHSLGALGAGVPWNEFNRVLAYRLAIPCLSWRSRRDAFGHTWLAAARRAGMPES